MLKLARRAHETYTRVLSPTPFTLSGRHSLLPLGTWKSADRSRLALRTSFIRGAILPEVRMDSESDAGSDSPPPVAKARPSTAAVLVDGPPWPRLPFRGLQSGGGRTMRRVHKLLQKR